MSTHAIFKCNYIGTCNQNHNKNVANFFLLLGLEFGSCLTNGKKQQFDNNNSVANPKTQFERHLHIPSLGILGLWFFLSLCGMCKNMGIDKRLGIFHCVFAIFEGEMRMIFL
jgi:hypothetical protein